MCNTPDLLAYEHSLINKQCPTLCGLVFTANGKEPQKKISVVLLGFSIGPRGLLIWPDRKSI